MTTRINPDQIIWLHATISDVPLSKWKWLDEETKYLGNRELRVAIYWERKTQQFYITTW